MEEIPEWVFDLILDGIHAVVPKGILGGFPKGIIRGLSVGTFEGTHEAILGGVPVDLYLDLEGLSKKALREF